MQETFTFCRICEAACGLKIHIDEKGDISEIKPNTEHVASAGYACLKGLKANEFRDSPDRITSPMKRVNGKLEAISWEQALTEIGGKLREIVQRDGGDALGMYIGNPISMSFLPPILSNAFIKSFGSSKLYHTGSQDCNNKFVVSERMYGSAHIQPFPDIDNCKFFIAVGSNPLISKMSFINFPHSRKRLEAMIANGGRIIWLNPRRTETAKSIGEHQFIRPNTDVYFMLSFLHVLIEIGAINRRSINAACEGWESVETLVNDWPPERSAAVTGIPATTIREWAAAFNSADGASIYSSTGVNQGSHGSLTFWLQEVINVVSGNLDRRGGSLVGKGIIDVARYDRFDPQIPKQTFRLADIPLVMGTVPAGVLADDILTPGKGQLKAFICTSGNPILSCANSERLRGALQELELLVAIDLVESETARHAHYLLPGSHWLERPDMPFAFISMLGTSPNIFHQYTDPVLPLKGESRDEISIFLDLCRKSGFPFGGSKLLQFAINCGHLGRKLPYIGKKLPDFSTVVLAIVNRVSGFGSLNKMRRQPHGVLRKNREIGSFIKGGILTPTAKINLAPPEFLAMSRALHDKFESEIQDNSKLKLISKRDRYSHNSWTFNHPSFVKGSRNRNYLYMNSEDAQRRDLQEDQWVNVFNAQGRLRVQLAISNDMMPGAVAMTHGWGQQDASSLAVASQAKGANVNILASDGPANIEKISGMVQFNGILVEVEAASELATAN